MPARSIFGRRYLSKMALFTVKEEPIPVGTEIMYAGTRRKSKKSGPARRVYRVTGVGPLLGKEVKLPTHFSHKEYFAAAGVGPALGRPFKQGEAKRIRALTPEQRDLEIEILLAQAVARGVEDNLLPTFRKMLRRVYRDPGNYLEYPNEYGLWLGASI